MTRRRFTERQALECAIRQGAIIPCYRCKVPFTVETIKTSEREHLDEVAAGGQDTVEGCAYSHGGCHAKVTRGTGATTAGTSIGRIRKAKRARTAKFAVQKRPRQRTLTPDLVSKPSRRCAKCGEAKDCCACPPKPIRHNFGRRK